MAQPRGLQFVF